MTRTHETWMNWDVARPVWGRDDAADLIAKCVEGIDQHITERHELLRASPDSARRASREIAAARMAAGPRLELERKVRDQAAVIDRLLAFVPNRARYLDSDRIQQIVLDLHHAAEELLGRRSIWSVVMPESDEETYAVHRIVLTIECDPNEDIDVFASGAFRLHKLLATMVPREEYLAIRLVVEPKLQVKCESVG